MQSCVDRVSLQTESERCLIYAGGLAVDWLREWRVGLGTSEVFSTAETQQPRRQHLRSPPHIVLNCCCHAQDLLKHGAGFASFIPPHTPPLVVSPIFPLLILLPSLPDTSNPRERLGRRTYIILS